MLRGPCRVCCRAGHAPDIALHLLRPAGPRLLAVKARRRRGEAGARFSELSEMRSFCALVQRLSGQGRPGAPPADGGLGESLRPHPLGEAAHALHCVPAVHGPAGGAGARCAGRGWGSWGGQTEDKGAAHLGRVNCAQQEARCGAVVTNSVNRCCLHICGSHHGHTRCAGGGWTRSRSYKLVACRTQPERTLGARALAASAPGAAGGGGKGDDRLCSRAPASVWRRQARWAATCRKQIPGWRLHHPQPAEKSGW